ncbi:DUF5358 family protein [Conservatibacter flavescens]|uniref:DUF5358 domain-containing protein n=1 Tax=Conservatibacter flavescens TaxID=28161 RepID=A0A2M8S420_9PAST|nr:DUF5358 family protein [Conservatibacter flavescens]PJG85895.1 hypothetical protein CVP05_03950 [Conservatibacter flavescens]
MCNKGFLFITLLSLTACTFSDNSQSPIPAQFAGADYQLSDQDAKRWVIAGNQVEQCVYPNLTRIQQEHFSQEDSFIYSQYVFFYPLEDIVGRDNLQIIKNDQKSMDYVTYQRKKFKDIKAKPLDEEKCAILQKQARDDLAVVKGEYRNAMVEEDKHENKTDNGKNLEKSRFSFDILKWGIGLMLL